MLDVMEDCHIAIFFLTRLPTLRCVVLCTGETKYNPSFPSIYGFERFKFNNYFCSEGVDEYAVNKFLCQVFSYGTNSSGEICSLIKESTSRKFDIKEEVLPFPFF